MDDILRKLNFAVAHMGVNLAGAEEAGQQAGVFLRLFGIEPEEGKDSIYAGPLVELMKTPGRGTHGHIAIGTDDIHAAQVYLEGLGCTFDPASAKYDSLGSLVVLYLREEIAGFAVHLLQRAGV